MSDVIQGRDTTTTSSKTGKNPLIEINAPGGYLGVKLVDPSGGLIASVSGGAGVGVVNDPSRDVYINWLYGTEDTYGPVLTANVAKVFPFAEMSLLNPNARSITIITGASATYNYLIECSRNSAPVAADTYTISSGTTTTLAIANIVIPATMGYDRYIRLTITPAVGQAGAQLNFKAYLAGRGG